MDIQRTYRFMLTLGEPEAVALARLARTEHRDMRTQAHHIVHRRLVDLGLLSDSLLEPSPPSR